MLRTSNPTLGESTFSSYQRVTATGEEAMTLTGTVNKCFIMLGLLVGGAAVTWYMFSQGIFSPVLFWGSLIGGLIVAIVLTFKKDLSPILAPIYAILEGLVLGSISAMYNQAFEGIVIQAVCLTMATFLCLLFVYKSGWIKATENFKMGIFAATAAIGVVYLVSFVMSMFGSPLSIISSNGTFGIIFSLIVVAIAALNLILDFDFIEKGAEYGAPKYMEWYGAFGLTVTLVWLYLEILRLLSKLRSK